MAQPESAGLARTLGLWEVTTITAGNILGSAIFVAAAFVPREVPHPTLVLLLWVAGPCRLDRRSPSAPRAAGSTRDAAPTARRAAGCRQSTWRSSRGLVMRAAT